MDTFLENNLKLAEVSDLKIKGGNDAIEKAQSYLETKKDSEGKYELVSTALEKVKDLETWEITPTIVNEVDHLINTTADLIVSDGDTKLSVTGTENFGLTLLPKDWKESRIQGMESLLAEIAKDIKRWANNTMDNIRDAYTFFRSSSETLRERLEEAKFKLDSCVSIIPGKETTALNNYICKALQKNNRVDFIKDVPGFIQKELGFIMVVFKSWEKENIDYKNNLFQYFGSKDKPLEKMNLFLSRKTPMVLTKDANNREIDKQQFRHTTTKDPLVGDVWLDFFNAIPLPDYTIYSHNLEKTGYHLSDSAKPVRDVGVIKTLSINEMESIRGQIEGLIGLIEGINSKDFRVNISPDDAKDIISTLRTEEQAERLKIFGNLIASQQMNVETTKGMIIRYLTLLTSTLITLLFMNMESYDES